MPNFSTVTLSNPSGGDDTNPVIGVVISISCDGVNVYSLSGVVLGGGVITISSRGSKPEIV